MSENMKNHTRHPEIDSGSNIPKLRFPEFKDAPEWEEKKLGEIATKNNLKNKNLEFSNVLTNSATDGIVSQRDYFDKDIANKNNLSGYYIVGVNDFVYNPRISSNALVGSLKRNNLEKGIMSPLYMVFRFKNGNLTFFEHYFETRHWHSYMKFIANTGAKFDRLNIGNEQFFNLPIPYPRLLEQQKIADCLSSLDDLITAQSQKAQALKEHKKALMQQLFPSDGENVPKLRFPEFIGAPEWEEKTLDEVVNYENGKAHENDISENGKYIVVNSKFISTEGDIRKFTNKAFCLANVENILMVLSDVPNGRAIAKCYLVESDDLYTVNQRICRLSSKKAVSKFLFYVLDRNKYFLSFDDGVKQTNLRKEDVLNCPILMPSNQEEQQKIADCLSSIDELITSKTAKVQVLKEHKKALMQQLFPSAKES